ncbi:MAG: hypothetical protein K5647_00260 [Clostridiales bacterium]|nr:hypothetical protein [Clostridiales bacterium]
MKCKQLIIYIFVALILLSLFGCADVSDDGNSTDLPGSGEISGEITTYALAETEAGTETDAAQTEPESSAPSAPVVDVSEVIFYNRYPDGRKIYDDPEISDLAIKALEERFSDCSSIKVIGVSMSRNQSPDYYKYDVIADGRGFVLTLTFDNEITIDPYEWDGLIADSEDGLLPIEAPEHVVANKGEYSFSLNGRQWVLGRDGLMCDGEKFELCYLNSERVIDVTLADVNGDGTKELFVICDRRPSSNGDHYLYVYDLKNQKKLLLSLPSVFYCGNHLRPSAGGTPSDCMFITANKKGEMVFVDYTYIYPYNNKNVFVYKVKYDASAESLRFVAVCDYYSESYMLNLEDERITG